MIYQMRVSGVSTPETADASLWRLHALAPSLFPAAEPKDSLLLLLLISGVSTLLLRACSRLRSPRTACCYFCSSF